MPSEPVSLPSTALCKVRKSRKRRTATSLDEERELDKAEREGVAHTGEGAEIWLYASCDDHQLREAMSNEGYAHLCT